MRSAGAIGCLIRPVSGLMMARGTICHGGEETREARIGSCQSFSRQRWNSWLVTLGSKMSLEEIKREDLRNGGKEVYT